MLGIFTSKFGFIYDFLFSKNKFYAKETIIKFFYLCLILLSTTEKLNKFCLYFNTRHFPHQITLEIGKHVRWD